MCLSTFQQVDNHCLVMGNKQATGIKKAKRPHNVVLACLQCYKLPAVKVDKQEANRCEQEPDEQGVTATSAMEIKTVAQKVVDFILELFFERLFC